MLAFLILAIVAPETPQHFHPRNAPLQNPQNEHSCFLNFLRNRLKSPGYLPVLAPDLPRPAPDTEHLLRQLLTSLPTYLLQGKLDPRSSHRFASNALILLDDLRSTSKLDASLDDLCNSKCVVLVVVGKGFRNEQDFAKESGAWARAMWARKVGNAAFVFRAGGAFFMAKSARFKANVECEPEAPVGLGSCKSGWGNWRAFEDAALLNNCTARAAFFPEEPYAVTGGEGSGVADGIEGDLLDLITEHLEVRMRGSEVAMVNESDYEGAIKEQLEGSDVVFGGLIWSPSVEVEYTLPYEVMELF